MVSRAICMCGLSFESDHTHRQHALARTEGDHRNARIVAHYLATRGFPEDSPRIRALRARVAMLLRGTQ